MRERGASRPERARSPSCISTIVVQRHPSRECACVIISAAMCTTQQRRGKQIGDFELLSHTSKSAHIFRVHISSLARAAIAMCIVAFAGAAAAREDTSALCARLRLHSAPARTRAPPRNVLARPRCWPQSGRPQKGANSTVGCAVTMHEDVLSVGFGCASAGSSPEALDCSIVQTLAARIPIGRS